MSVITERSKINWKTFIFNSELGGKYLYASWSVCERKALSSEGGSENWVKINIFPHEHFIVINNLIIKHFFVQFFIYSFDISDYFFIFILELVTRLICCTT